MRRRRRRGGHPLRAPRHLGLDPAAGLVALINALLIVNLAPGGLLDLAGFAPPWPVSPAAFAWFGNTGTYLLIGGMFVVEFAVRVWRFPNYRFRNPLHFIREARTRMPNIVAALRHG